MRRHPFAILHQALLLAGLILHPSAFIIAQGPLAPPGAPAPTMKTLDQVEARTPIDPTQPGFALPFTISQPGSYYLTGNVTATGSSAGIIIAVDNVTLDLNGFALVGGGAGAARGINVPAVQKNICVRNGVLQGWTGGGVRADNASKSMMEGLRCSNNPGSGSVGLAVGDNSVIRERVASNNGGSGIQAGNGCTLGNCAASENQGTDGIFASAGCMLNDCAAFGNQGAYGIDAGNGCVLTHCAARSNTSSSSTSAGIVVAADCTVLSCAATANATTFPASGAQTGMGILVGSGAMVRNCTANANRGDAIAIQGSNGQIVGNMCDGSTNNDGIGFIGTVTNVRIESNNVTNCFAGIHVGTGGNLIIKNSASNNNTNYIIAADNRYGPVVNITATGAAGMSGNSAASTLTSTDPWANFSY